VFRRHTLGAETLLIRVCKVIAVNSVSVTLRDLGTKCCD
jgi:hypothetical protein